MEAINPAYASAIAALAGATIGGLTSFATAWFTQRSQLRRALYEAEIKKLEALYSDFMAEATRLFGLALTSQPYSVTEMIQLYGLVGRMRLTSPREVVDAAVQVERVILKTFVGKNLSVLEVVELAQGGGLDFLSEFGEACRKDLLARSIIIG